MLMGLVAANCFVLLLALGMVVVGVWGYKEERKLSKILEEDSVLTHHSLSLVVLGVVVAVLGLMGLSGVFVAKKMIGRLVLGTYGFVFILVLITELGSGSSALRSSTGDAKESFINQSYASFADYGVTPNVTETWDTFQEDHKCCGVANYTSYHQIFRNTTTVPASCCNTTVVNHTTCSEIRQNVTINLDYIYERGCPDAVWPSVKGNLITVGVCALIFTALQCVGTVMAFVVAVYSQRREDQLFQFVKYTRPQKADLLLPNEQT